MSEVESQMAHIQRLGSLFDAAAAELKNGEPGVFGSAMHDLSNLAYDHYWAKETLKLMVKPADPSRKTEEGEG